MVIEIVNKRKGALKCGEIVIPLDWADIENLKKGFVEDRVPFFSKDSAFSVRGRSEVVGLYKEGNITTLWKGEPWEVSLFVKRRSLELLFKEAGVRTLRIKG